jgi:hypothetical protein
MLSENMENTRALVNRETGEIVESRPLPVKLSEEAIAITISNMQMAEKLVFKVLERDVDYGKLPGLPGESLFDPGAQKLANAFNTYPKHNVLFCEETDNRISYTMETQLISRDSQQVVGSGIGAASTMEPKNKYRWVRDPENYGYSVEEIQTLKTRGNEDAPQYRILNPEYGELVNTIAQMAAKRSEVDATKSLPGVGSALKKLFTGKQRPDIDWDRFWANAKNMGLNQDQVHAILNVKSMKEWLSKGKTLNDAVKEISTHLAKGKHESQHSGEGPEPSIDETETEGEDKAGEQQGKNLTGGVGGESESALSSPKGKGEKHPEMSSARANARAEDILMAQSSAGKLKWDHKRLMKELKERTGFTTFEATPDDKLHEFATKITDLAEVS